MQFGERLRFLREKSQMTQAKLAEVSGVQSRMIQRYEAGTSYPRISVVEKLAVALNVSVDEIIGSDTPANQLQKSANSSSVNLYNSSVIEKAQSFSNVFFDENVSKEEKDAALKIILRAYANAIEETENGSETL